MTRDERIVAIMDNVTNGTAIDLALLRAASDRFIEQLHGQVEALDRTTPARDEEVAEDIAYIRLIGRQDPMPGITLYATLGPAISYQSGGIWVMDAMLPDTIRIAAKGRSVADLVELPVGLPGVLAKAVVDEVRNFGSKNAGFNLRIELMVRRWGQEASTGAR